MNKIIDTFDRGKLSEGRNYGVGFAILDKINNEEYKALNAFTACKDYLNDFVYIETTNKPLSIIYGFTHEYTGVFKDKDYFYLGLKALNTNHSSSKHELFDKITDLFRDNHQNIIKALNKVEEYFKVKDRSTFADYIDNTLVIKVPMFWTKFSFMFSLYGLLTRCFIGLTEEDLKKDILTIIKDLNNPTIVADNMLFKTIQKFFEKSNLGSLLDYKYPDNAQSGYIHNFGICGRINEMKLI